MSEYEDNYKVHLTCFNCYTSQQVDIQILKRLESYKDTEDSVSVVIHCKGCGYDTFHSSLL